ncbi:hypothetical protein C3E78_02570 [Aeromicrobium chenweiae]|uniref:Uncharacterized protein n=1 Tax=Aeromicrobium chenweiae TaxID=2079793 RepID=A0A2S0WIT5_9ACTN|nr:hypothetical protein C3E78_02570 [Aeromicrobium chenweiae]TGN31712.1 hypothetical protein E4L97_12080 [Aeromicrobium chenweiae]
MPAEGSPRLLANSAWVLSGNLVYGACLALVPLVIGRMGSLDDVGQYTLGFAVSAPVIAVSMVQLRVLMVTDSARTVPFSAYRTARVISTLGAALVIGGIALAWGGSQGTVLAIVGAAKCMDAVGDCYLGFFQAQSRLDVMGLSMILNGVLTLVSVSALLAVGLPMAGAALGSLGSSIVASVVYPRALQRRAADDARVRGWDLRGAVSQLRLASHLGVASGISSLNSNVPRYVLQVFSGTAPQGVFSALAQLMLLVTMTAGAVAQAVLPWFVGSFGTRSTAGLRSALLKVLAGAALGGLGFVLVVWAVGGPLLDDVYGPGFAGRGPLLTWLAAGAAIGSLAWFLDAALSTMRVLAPQMWLNLLTLAVTSVACLLLVPDGGPTGAAQAALVGMTAHLVPRMLLLRRRLGQDARA